MRVGFLTRDKHNVLQLSNQEICAEVGENASLRVSVIRLRLRLPVSCLVTFLSLCNSKVIPDLFFKKARNTIGEDQEREFRIFYFFFKLGHRRRK